MPILTHFATSKSLIPFPPPGGPTPQIGPAIVTTPGVTTTTTSPPIITLDPATPQTPTLSTEPYATTPVTTVTPPADTYVEDVRSKRIGKFVIGGVILAFGIGVVGFFATRR